MGEDIERLFSCVGLLLLAQSSCKEMKKKKKEKQPLFECIDFMFGNYILTEAFYDIILYFKFVSLDWLGAPLLNQVKEI